MNPEHCTCRGDPLGMISRGPCDDTLAGLVLRQLTQTIIGTANLECPDDLQALGFEENFAARDLVKFEISQKWCSDTHAVESKRCCFDVRNINHQACSAASRSIFAAHMKSLSDRPLIACVV